MYCFLILSAILVIFFTILSPLGQDMIIIYFRLIMSQV
jgi:hypothetical protein